VVHQRSGLSHRNSICLSVGGVGEIWLNDLRSKLSAVNLAALMFVLMNGSPLRNWNVLPYVKSWLARDCRDATH